MKKCLLCDAKATSRRLCPSHYMRELHANRLEKYPRILTPVSIETRVKKTRTCWLWTGDHSTLGYGVVTTIKDGRRLRENAHRYVYKLLVGPIPIGMVVMHRCDNPPCVRPSHLRLGTIADNNRDCGIKRRHNYGLDHWNGRLTATAIKAIRQSKEPQSILAARYKCSQPYISRVRRGLRRV